LEKLSKNTFGIETPHVGDLSNVYDTMVLITIITISVQAFAVLLKYWQFAIGSK